MWYLSLLYLYIHGCIFMQLLTNWCLFQIIVWYWAHMYVKYVFVLELLTFKTYLQVADNWFSLVYVCVSSILRLMDTCYGYFNPIKCVSGRSTCPCNLQSRICCRLSMYSDYHQIMTSNDNYLHISIVTHFWDFLITTLYYDDASCWNKTVQHIGERTTLLCCLFARNNYKFRCIETLVAIQNYSNRYYQGRLLIYLV